MAEKTGIRKWLPLVVLVLALFIIVLDTTIINVSMKAIITDLHTNLKAVQWVITGYSLTLAAFTITGGRLGDIFGRKRMFRVGALVFALGSLFASQAHSQPELLAAVALVEGVGAAMMMPSTAALILAEYQGKDRAVAFGMFGAAAGTAATVGPLLGGFLTTNYSWRWNYLINPFVVVALLLGSRLLHESHVRTPHKPDLASILLSALGLAGVVYGIIESSTYGWLKAKNSYEIFNHHYTLGGASITVYALVIGIVFLVGFLWRQRLLEQKGEMPLVSLGIFKNRQFMAGSTVTMIVAMTQFGFIFILPVFLQGMLGKDAFHTGLSLLPFSLSVMVAGPLSGILVGKANVAPKFMIQLGLVISVLGAFLLRQEFSDTATATTIMPGQVVFAIGFGLAFSQLANLTLSAVSVQQAGEASGLNNTLRQVGASLGQALIGALLISALLTQLNTDVSASKVLPASSRSHIAADVASSAESLGTANGNVQQLPAPITHEITRIKNDAIIKGVRTGLIATIGVAIIALVVSTQLPWRPHQAADMDRPKKPASAGA
ncbi:MAG TPA: MFS transporter [Candidatus Saccharimonadales bacterium]|nr:MFS transporter [Candidatus Saccharimonadales bacterium]